MVVERRRRGEGGAEEVNTVVDFSCDHNAIVWCSEVVHASANAIYESWVADEASALSLRVKKMRKMRKMRKKKSYDDDDYEGASVINAATSTTSAAVAAAEAAKRRFAAVRRSLVPGDMVRAHVAFARAGGRRGGGA